MKQLYTVNIDTNKLIVSNKISIINDAINITEKQRNALIPEHIESAWNTALNQIHETLFNRAIDDYKRYYTTFVYYGILCNIEYSSNGVFTITGRDDYKHITLVMYLNNEFNYKYNYPSI